LVPVGVRPQDETKTQMSVVSQHPGGQDDFLGAGKNLEEKLMRLKL